MKLSGKIAVVTGGAQGIGRAIAAALIAEHANVAILDLDPDAVSKTAHDLGAYGAVCDVTQPSAIQEVIKDITHDLGNIDIWVSNAGVISADPDHVASASDQIWQLAWDIHVMAHVWAARALLPDMIARGSGYFVNTASAAGLLSQIGDAPYSATKAAAISFAQSLAISHGDDGIRSSVICPQYVASSMLGYDADDIIPDHPGLLSTTDVARAVIDGMKEQQFLILPHPIVAEYAKLRAGNPEKWIKGMQKLRRRILSQTEGIDPKTMHLLI
jgi:NAD(P)-dependent dehydrogenase (short-subunit alcohol dehydrogenase family)